VLAGLGVPGLDPLSDETSLAAAAELCREAGRVALPYPAAGVLAGGAERPFAVVDQASPGPWRVDHADLFPDWEVGGVGGRSGTGRPTGSLGTRLGPFAGDLSGVWSGSGSDALRSSALHLTLTAWTILGAMEAALDAAVSHVGGRIQFGQALSEFQSVQFQLADAAVAVEGLRESARFTLWRVLGAAEDSITDALALRLAALDSARAVFRTTQQLHGASGLCDEYDVSILLRHTQPALRLPYGAEQTAEALFDSVQERGFASLFPHGRSR
jgi:hypothetical protein